MWKGGMSTGSYRVDTHVELYVRIMIRILFENFSEITTHIWP